MVPMNPSQQPLPPTQFINPFIHMHWRQPLVTANTTVHAGPVYQGMTTSQQHHGQHQWAPRSGPSRNRRNQGFRQTVPLYINQFTHESSSTTVPQVSIQSMPRSTATTQERERYGEPRQRTYWWLTATYLSRGDAVGVLATRLDPLSSWSQRKNWKVTWSWFHYQVSTI